MTAFHCRPEDSELHSPHPLSMVTLQLRQIREPLALPALTSPLGGDQPISLEWSITPPADGSNLRIHRQEIKVSLGPNHSLSFHLTPEDRKSSFRLPQGLEFQQITAELSVWMRGENNPVTVDCAIHFPSSPLPERESLSSLYSENQQELRRMRTLYESLVIFETAAFAIFYSKGRPELAGLSFQLKFALAASIVLLDVIVIFLIHELASRYYRISRGLENIEIVLGIRNAQWPDEIFGNYELSDAEAKPHRRWAAMLTSYTILLSLAAFLFMAQSH